jgi:CRISPR-associated helicase Cas3/CRISPR-associated endonuclease Cas3-HD
MTYYAHSKNKAEKKHPLAEHLGSVSRIAGEFAEASGFGEEARLAGLLHDLGKYGDRFQRRLEGEEQGLDHWSAGAWLACIEHRAVAAALAIQGHHVGLQCMRRSELLKLSPAKLVQNHPLQLRLTEENPDPAILKARLTADGLIPIKPAKPIIGTELKSGFGSMLDIRLLFSALADADFLDTEAHFEGGPQGKNYCPSGPPLRAAQALAILLAEIERLGRESKANSKVAAVREWLRADCLAAADLPPGLFTLTAPTGSGKTLAMLAFALAHAVKHDLRRVVLVVPYLSIIEQTAAIYRNLFEPRFGKEYVLEHHSLAGLGREASQTDAEGERGESDERRRRLLSENWDAPIIVTTSVQMLGSLFSNRPSACRKLHRLPRSVILFDEVQTLPAPLAIPTLASLSHLAHRHGGSIVFATATQPAFEHLHSHVRTHAPEGWQPRRIVPRPERLFAPMRRVQREWGAPDQPVSWPDLARQLRGERQVLCVVNLKRHAQALWKELDEPDAFHLSTNLCPAHRQALLAEVRRRLTNAEPARLIATQCVEAGVDLDFPAVWRAFGPLEAIIQAEGRCNREGRREERGRVRVFMPESDGKKQYPPGGYEQAAQVTQMLLKRHGPDGMGLDDPEFIAGYYRELYDLAAPESARKTQELLGHVMGGDFPEIAKNYRLIENDTINVIVPYAGELDLFHDIRQMAEKNGLTGELIRKARPLAVGLFRPKRDAPVWDSLLEVQSFKEGRRVRQEEWYIAAKPEHYHPQLGYMPPEGLNVWIG